MTEIKYSKKCPECNIILFYKNQNSLNKSIKKNRSCKTCTFAKKALSNKLIEQILLLNETGLLNREIARKLNISHRSVGYYLKKIVEVQNLQINQLIKFQMLKQFVQHAP